MSQGPKGVCAMAWGAIFLLGNSRHDPPSRAGWRQKSDVMRKSLNVAGTFFLNPYAGSQENKVNLILLSLFLFSRLRRPLHFP